MTSLGNNARCKKLVCEELGISMGALRFSLGLSTDGTFQIINEVTNTVVFSSSDSTSPSNIPTLPSSSELSLTNPDPMDRTHGWFLSYDSDSNTYVWEQLNSNALVGGDTGHFQ
eukprot:792863-Prymnesium_polylepis.1